MNQFADYVDAVDRVVCFLNAAENPETVFVQAGDERTIHRPDILSSMREMVGHAE